MSESKFKSGIYKITINSYYIYIGQSVNIERRWSTHLNELKQNKKLYNKKFQNVFNKYPDKIKFEIIELCDIDKLDEREMYWIEYYSSYNTKYGLNMSIGGDCGCRKYVTREEAEAATLKKRKEYYKVHKEELREYSKQWYDEHKKEIHFNGRCYYKKNRKRLILYTKNYTEEHIEQRKIYCKKWYSNNREKFIEERRRNRKINQKKYKENKKQNRLKYNKLRFEKRYNLSRSLTDKEYNIWQSGKGRGVYYAIKYLKSLPNITFTIPSKK